MIRWTDQFTPIFATKPMYSHWRAHIWLQPFLSIRPRPKLSNKKLENGQETWGWARNLRKGMKLEDGHKTWGWARNLRMDKKLEEGHEVPPEILTKESTKSSTLLLCECVKLSGGRWLIYPGWSLFCCCWYFDLTWLVTFFIFWSILSASNFLEEVIDLSWLVLVLFLVHTAIHTASIRLLFCNCQCDAGFVFFFFSSAKISWHSRSLTFPPFPKNTAQEVLVWCVTKCMPVNDQVSVSRGQIGRWWPGVVLRPTITPITPGAGHTCTFT